MEVIPIKLSFLQYNNYYNRIAKWLDTYAKYVSNAGFIGELVDVNFVPGDGVTTTQIFNTDLGQVPDYCVVADDDGTLNSRWFVIEFTRTRNGQYKASLYRDTVADSHEELLHTPMFIEKACVPPTNPLVYNDEQITTNQIKQKEQLLSDNSGCPWIVGYYARTTNGSEITTLSGTAITMQNLVPDISVSGISNWVPYGQYVNGAYIGVPGQIVYSIPATLTSIPPKGKTVTFTDDGTLFYPNEQPRETVAKGYQYNSFSVLNNTAQSMDEQRSTIVAQTKALANYHTSSEVTGLLSLEGKILQDVSSGKYYKISVVKTGSTTTMDITPFSNLDNTLRDIMDRNNWLVSATRSPMSLYVSAPVYSIRLTEVKSQTLSYNIPQRRNFTLDAPYDIFAMPYSDEFETTVEGATYKSSKDIALAVANSMGSDTHVYDIQLLPYCPFDVSSFAPFEYTTADTKAYSYINDGASNHVGVIFNVTSTTIKTAITAIEALRPTNLKLANQTQMARIVSPNYDGAFEFTPARNGGVDYFVVDQTCKPYQPYIHVAPNWKQLYGSDFDDARGLICGGDFSLPRLNDEWKAYQTANKNYLNSFNRQIENMEINNKYARANEIVSAISGAVGLGVGAGMLAGPKLGVPFGVGAGIASGAAGATDIYINDQLRKEQLDYTKDQFGFNLENIKARPITLARVGALNANNKLFPFVEIYDCTETEKAAVAGKIAMNGMTIGVVDTLDKYINNTWSCEVGSTRYNYQGYVKGKPIRLTELNDESHYASTLSQEMVSGVYWWGTSRAPNFTEVI